MIDLKIVLSKSRSRSSSERCRRENGGAIGVEQKRGECRKYETEYRGAGTEAERTTSRSRSECSRRESGGAVSAERDRRGPNAVGVRMEAR